MGNIKCGMMLGNYPHPKRQDRAHAKAVFVRRADRIVENETRIAEGRNEVGARDRGVRRRVVAGLLWIVAHDGSALVGDDSPEHLDATYGTLSLVCLVRPLCPISSDALDEMKGALAGRSDAEYGLALALLTGDGLPSDRAAGIAWMARAAEHGEPGAARDVNDRLRNGENVAVDERQIASALQKRVDAGDAEAMRALGPMIVRGRGVKQDLGGRRRADAPRVRSRRDRRGRRSRPSLPSRRARPAGGSRRSISIGCRRRRGAANSKRCCRSATPR